MEDFWQSSSYLESKFFKKTYETWSIKQRNVNEA